MARMIEQVRERGYATRGPRAETRSSTSVNAVLKDFVVGVFPVCGVNITATCPSSRPNPNETGFIYDFSGVVTNTGVGTLFDVTVVDDAGTPGVPGDDITFNIGTLVGGASATYSGSFESTLNPATHTASVTAAVSPGGRLYATSGWDGQLIVWNVVSRRPILQAPSGYAFLQFANDGKRLAAGGFGRASVWEVVEPAEFRTEPLMGLRLREKFMHDAAASTIEEAIELHAGEATQTRDRFRKLNPKERAALLKFLDSL